MAAGEEVKEARRGFSVLFMSQTLGLTFDLSTGVPVVDEVRPVFTAPREGDVLTAINGAELSKLGLTVPQLVLALKALPRPVKLSFVDGSRSLQVMGDRGQLFFSFLHFILCACVRVWLWLFVVVVGNVVALWQ